MRFAFWSRQVGLVMCILGGAVLHGLSAQEKGLVWPQFRGPGGMGMSPEKKLPVTWGPRENVVWKVDLPGPGTSQPIVVGNRIYLTSYAGYGVPDQPRGDMEQLKLALHCLDRGSGKILWSKDIAPKLPEQATIREGHGYASSTPAADAERLYVFFGKTGLFAFDHDGKELWKADVGSGLNGWGTANSPVLFGDLVIINASVESQSLVAFDRKTGQEKWRAGGIRESWNTPVLVPVEGGKTELVVAIMGKVLGFDPNTGQQLWSCNTDIGWYMVPSLVAHEGVVYCVGGRTGGALAVRAGGRNEVTQSHRIWTGRKGSNVTSPLFHEGHLYWAHENLGIVYCAEAKTGNIVYEERLPRGGQVYASPVLADGKIYYIARNGRTFVVSAQPRFELLATNDLEERGIFNASPAVAGGQLFVRSNRALYCLGLQAGQP
jgi:outer membrane protein assembly factor BamB